MTIPTPILSTEKKSNADTPLFTIPTFGTANQSLGEIKLNQVQFNVKLAWENGKLGILVGVENNNRFVAFENLPFVLVNQISHGRI